jgi:hypothetical protein
MDSCEEVAKGVYGCEWEDFEDENVRKKVVMVVKRSQRGDGFKILNCIKIDMEQFVRVSWEFFN